jgi:pimeloyl-ACP methyl ester carboxylesterase
VERALNEGHVEVGELRFAYLECGSGPLALCLHGFPDSAWTFRHLLPALAEAGYRAVAPWMRGYAPTSLAPDGNYQTGALVADACGLHQALGGDDGAVVIGHDWGAFAARGAAAFAPERWRRVVILALPPMPAIAQGLFAYDQLRRSWYTFLFQQPIADEAVRLNDLEFIDRLWADWSPGYDATEDVRHAKEALRDPANLAAALGYYRTAFDPTRRSDALEAQEAAVATPHPLPELYLHGADDGAMGVELARSSEPFLAAPGSRLEIIEHSGHFLHLEQPGTVHRLVLEFPQAEDQRTPAAPTETGTTPRPRPSGPIARR